MSRYIERAENTVRLVDVTLQTLLESEQSADGIDYHHWEPILLSLGDHGLFEKLYEDHSSHNVIWFLTFSTDNPSSVFGCIAAARENARMIRDQISTEMWETINRLYLFLKKTDAQRVCRELNFDFFQRIKEYSMLFQGIKETTFNHKLGYEFLTCGYQLERADKTSRIVDAKRFMRTMDDNLVDALDDAQWTAILRGCSAYDAYHQEFVSNPARSSVVQFLLLSRDFPRSVFYCVSRLQLAMHAISKCPVTHFSNEGERQVGELVANLNYLTPKALEGEKVWTLIEDVQDRLAGIALELSNQYMFSDITDPSAELVEG